MTHASEEKAEVKQKTIDDIQFKKELDEQEILEKAMEKIELEKKAE